MRVDRIRGPQQMELEPLIEVSAHGRSSLPMASEAEQRSRLGDLSRLDKRSTLLPIASNSHSQFFEEGSVTVSRAGERKAPAFRRQLRGGSRSAAMHTGLTLALAASFLSGEALAQGAEQPGGPAIQQNPVPGPAE